MTKTINSDLIRGNINTIILKALYNGDRYGYDIIKDIEEKSRGQYVLKQPTLYSCLKRLESQGFITSYWSGEQSNGGRRKYYSLTDMGREVFVQSQDEYEYSRTIIDQLISDKSYNLDEVEKPDGSESTHEETAAIDAEPDFEDEETNATETENEPEEIIPDEITYDATESVSTDDTTDNNENTDTPNTEEQPTITATPPSSVIDDLLSADATSSYTGNVINETIDTSPVARNGESGYFISSNFDLPSAFDAETDTSAAIPYDFSTNTFSEDLLPPEVSTAATETTAQTYSSEFLSYNTPLPSKPAVPREETRRPSTQYRAMLSGIIEDFEPESDNRQQSTTLKKEEIIAESTLSVKEKIRVRNFGKLTDSIRELGDDVKIRTPDSNAVHAYNKQYLYYRNKLSLFQFGILFVIMLIESFLTFIIVKSAIKINTNYDVILYVGAIIVSVALPIIAGINYLSEPYKRKRADFNLKSSMIFRIIIMLQLILITYAFNVYLGMPISGSKEYLLPLLLPMILSTNVPVSGLIFNVLYKSKRFAVE